MRKFIKTIAAMQAAVLLLTNTAFADELFEEAPVSMDAGIEADMSFDNETAGSADVENVDAEGAEAEDVNDGSEDEMFDAFNESGEDAVEEEEFVEPEAEDVLWESLGDAGQDLIEGDDFMDEMEFEELVMLGANAPSEWKEIHKYYKSVYDGMLDALALAAPEIKPLVPLLKLLLGNTLFKEGPAQDNTGEIIKEKLNDISTQIKTLEQTLKDHTYNVVSLAQIGDKYSTVKDKALTVNTHISDIMDDNTISYDEQRKEIADIYKSAEFDSLISAMNGATDCFYSSENNIFEKKNIFDAAYDRACEEVMFSREAIDISLPYIMTQYAIYAAAYATMSEVYDAYEEVYGAGKLNKTRELMTERMFGGNLQGELTGKSILELIGDYANRDKFVFVNRSNNTNIKVNPTMMYVINMGGILPIELHSQAMRTPDYVRKNPLNQDQVKALNEYCNKMGVSLWNFLFCDMQFEPAVLFNKTLYTADDIRNNFLLRICLPIVEMRGGAGWGINLNAEHANEVYLATRYTNENMDKDDKYYPGIYGSGYEVDWYYMNSVKMSGKDHSVERKQILRYSKSDREDVGERTEYDCNFVFFCPR